MGLLDDLKNQAERMRADGEVRQSEQAQCEAYYQAQIRPALLRALDYLNELLEQVRVVQPQVHAEFHLPGHAKAIATLQAIPRLALDSRDNIRMLSLRTEYVASHLEFSVGPLIRAEETRDFLLASRQTFADWPLREASGQITGLRFAVAELSIPAAVTLLADIPNRRLMFHSANMGGFHDQRDALRPEQVDDAWLDRLGRYLLGQGISPVLFELPEEQRAALQRAVEMDRAQRERELAEANRIFHERQQRERLGPRVQRLLGSMKQRLPRVPPKG